MSKLLEDDKVAKLVDREVKKAVKEDRKRILEGVKSLKEDAGDLEPKMKREVTSKLSSVSKIVRDAA